MATLTVEVPNALIPELIAGIDAWAKARGIDVGGLTDGQKGRLYVREMLRELYRAQKVRAAQDAAQAAIVAAQEAGATEAGGIT